MEPTDFAVRIEFDRGGYVLPEESRFMNRGIDFALSMFNYDAISIDTIKEQFFCHPRVVETQNDSSEYSIIGEERTKCFKVNRIDVKGTYLKQADSFYIGIVTQGEGIISINDRASQVKVGTKFFVPYATEVVNYESEKGMEVLITFPPD